MQIENLKNEILKYVDRIWNSYKQNLSEGIRFIFDN